MFWLQQHAHFPFCFDVCWTKSLFYLCLHLCLCLQTQQSSGWRNWPATSSEQPSQDPQPGRAGSGGWCAGGLCFRRGRTVSGPAGCGGAAQDEEEEEEEEEEWLVELCQCWRCDRSVLCNISYVVCEWKRHNSISFPEVAVNCTSRLILQSSGKRRLLFSSPFAFFSLDSDLIRFRFIWFQMIKWWKDVTLPTQWGASC